MGRSFLRLGARGSARGAQYSQTASQRYSRFLPHKSTGEALSSARLSSVVFCGHARIRGGRAPCPPPQREKERERERERDARVSVASLVMIYVLASVREREREREGCHLPLHTASSFVLRVSMLRSLGGKVSGGGSLCFEGCHPCRYQRVVDYWGQALTGVWLVC